MLTRAAHARRGAGHPAGDGRLAVGDGAAVAGRGRGPGGGSAAAPVWRWRRLLTSAMLALAPEGIPRLADAQLNLPVALAALRRRRSPPRSSAASDRCAWRAGPSVRDALPGVVARHRRDAADAAAQRAGRRCRWRWPWCCWSTAGLVTRSFQALARPRSRVPAGPCAVGADRSADSSRPGSTRGCTRSSRRWRRGRASRPSARSYLRPLALGPDRPGHDGGARGPTRHAGDRRRQSRCSTTRWRRRATSRRCGSRCAPAGSSPPTTATAASGSSSSASRRRAGCGRDARRSASGC